MSATFQSGASLDTLPKRIGSGRKFNQDGADALLKIVSATPGATASDGTLYQEAVKSRSAAGAAKRLLEHVTDPETIKTRTYKDGDGFRWVVYLKPKATDQPSDTTDAAGTDTPPVADTTTTPPAVDPKPVPAAKG